MGAVIPAAGDSPARLLIIHAPAADAYFADGVAETKVLEAGLQSAATGQRIEIK